MKSWPKLDGALADYVDANWLRDSPLKRRLREETAKLPQPARPGCRVGGNPTFRPGDGGPTASRLGTV